MANTTNFNWETPDDTDLVKDGAAAIRTLGNSIDTSFVDLKGGTTGQVLAKASNTDLDFSWVAQDDSNAIQNAIVDAKGDLITATANDTPARLAVGTNGQVLQADSTTATGLKWATIASGGKLLQVVQGTTTTATGTNSSTYIDTTLSASITPSANTSKVLVVVNQDCNVFRSGSVASGNIKLVRGSTDIWVPANRNFSYSITGATLLDINGMLTMVYLDSPSTTSSTTYKTQVNYTTTGGSITTQNNSGQSTITLFEIGA